MRNLFSAVLLCISACCQANAARPKHILAVVIDDLGFDDLGFRNQNQIKTPHFNHLAGNGIVLSNYYVQPSCSPTRATIMTGRKPLHTGINFWIPDVAFGLKLDEVTFADVLNKRGFVSHAVGKWHLGFHKTSFTPTFRGFSSFFGYYEGSEDYFQHTAHGGMDLHYEEGHNCGANCTQLLWDLQGQYSTNLYGARAVEIIEKHDPATPLFIYLAWQGVHSPRQSPQHYIDPYMKTIANSARRTFAGMVSALDEGMGNVSAALEAKGMYDDTLIFVTTDNGGPTTECAGIGASNYPYRGSKCSIWEGGTHGTSFVYWSGMPAAVQGTTWGGLAHAADWLPTALSAIGQKVQPGETLPLDGIDLWDALMQNATSPRTSVYYGISEKQLGPAVRDAEGYKLILASSGGGKGQWSPEQLPNVSVMSPWYDDNIVALKDEMPLQDPTPGTGGILMFYLPEDQGERTNLTTPAASAAFTRLHALVEQYDKTKVPQQKGDPSCPKFSPRDSPKGKWIGPWCD